MRAAPSVEVHAALRGVWWLAACALWLSAAATLIGWAAWHWVVPGPSSLSDQLPGLLAVLLSGLGILSAAGAALWHARRHPARLQWDGQAWHCTVPGDQADELLPGRVDLMLDVGDAMLLRWQSDQQEEQAARTVWLPVARSAQPGAWHGLRVALQRAGTGAAA